jgi:hypothetical protein
VVVALLAAAPAHASAPRAPSATPSRLAVVGPGDSIQAAVDRLASGGTVELETGTYHQRVHLHDVHGVTLRPAPGATPVLDGSGLTPPKGLTALVAIAGSSDVTVTGLAITGYRTSRLGVVPAGVYVHGHDTGVHIVGNHVHDLGNDNGTLGSFDINAHGIAAYGDDPHHAITGLVIRGNTVDHLRTGASETVVVNGNVDHWRIVDNNIHDDDNIGIDAIGFEPTLHEPYRYTARDRARHGLIAGNRVDGIRSKGNPAYWEDGSWCDCADGIYVDGGEHIHIRDNHVTHSDIGIEVAAENARGSAEHVLVTHNRVSGSLYVGITTGGYCNDTTACGGVQTGASFDNVFSHNVLRDDNGLDDGSPELLVQYHAYRDTFRDNSLTATDSAHAVYGTVPEADTDGHPGTNRSDHNHFHVVGGRAGQARFGWAGHTYVGLAAFRRATGQDRHSSVS